MTDQSMRRLVQLGALLVVTFVAIGLAWPVTSLTVADENGRSIWRAPVAEGSRVVLHYTNSLYLSAVEDRFTVASEKLRLIEVASAGEAVLEYNRYPGPYRREGKWVVATVPRVTLETLALRVGERGRPMLSVDGLTIPLFRAGVGAGLRITVTRSPRILVWAGDRLSGAAFSSLAGAASGP